MNWEPIEGCYNCLRLLGRECEITLEPRPHYCDRGNWVAKLHPVGALARDIDHADAWPRYYFDIERAKAELEAWLRKRGQVATGEPAHWKPRETRAEITGIREGR